MIPWFMGRRAGSGSRSPSRRRSSPGARGRSTGDLAQPAPSGDDDGHAHLARRRRVVHLVGSLCSSSGSEDHLYFEVAAVVVVLVLAGRYAEARAKHRAGSAFARTARHGSQDRVGARRRWHRARRSRSKTCTSAIGSSSGRARRSPPTVSWSRGRRPSTRRLLTGESLPVEVGPGSPVTGATINVGRPSRRRGDARRRRHRARADRPARRRQAQSGKAQAQRLADRVSAVFVPAVIVVAAGHARRPGSSRRATPTRPSRPRSPS